MSSHLCYLVFFENCFRAGGHLHRVACYNEMCFVGFYEGVQQCVVYIMC